MASVCHKIGYEFQHHNALEDAKASGQVLLAAIQKSNLGLDMWLKRVKQPINPERSSQGAAMQRIGNLEGDLHGEVVVFTGELEPSRSTAADLISKAGCNVDDGLTKRTTMLVMGYQDPRKLNGKTKSNTQLKAEKYITKGQKIRILNESDFYEIISSVNSD